MRQPTKLLALAALLAASGAFAQAPAPSAPGTPGGPAAGELNRAAPARGEGRRMRDPAERAQRMAQHQDKRMAELKGQLKLTPAQEGAWTTFSSAMRPPAAGARPPMPAREEFARLTTPERIDRMQAIHAERDAQMKQRGDAVKAFYAQLTPEQRKVFDQRSLPHARDGREHDGHGHGHGPRGTPPAAR